MTEFTISPELFAQLRKATIRSFIWTSGPKLFLECINCESSGTITLEDYHTGETSLHQCPECQGDGEFELVVEDEDELPLTTIII